MPRRTFISQVADRLHRDADRAEQITGLVLHELRDRLSEANAAQVASHLPTALRPLWIERDRHPGTTEQPYQLEFFGAVMESGGFANSTEAEGAVIAVFTVLQGRLDRVVRNARGLSAVLPDDLAVLWRAAEACGTDVYRRGPLPVARRARATARSSAA